MQITGEMLIGRSAVRGERTSPCTRSIPPRAKRSPRRFSAAARRKTSRRPANWRSKRSTRTAPCRSTVRAEFLERIADGITGLGDALIERAQEESGLPKARLEGERGRTIGQLKLFAQVVRDGQWLAATLDSPLPERKPLPRSDLRMQKIAHRPGRRVRREQFPARVFGRRRRYRVGARGGLPGRREGAQRAPRHVGDGRPRDPAGREGHGPARRRVLDDRRRGPDGRRGAGRASGDQGGRLHRFARGRHVADAASRRAAPSRSRSTPK